MRSIDNYIDLLSLKRNIESSIKREDEFLWREIFCARFECLCLIYRLKSVSPSVLVKELDIAKSNIASICKGLERQGKIVHTRDNVDKRVIFYNITTKGKYEVESKISQLDKILCKNIDDTQQKNLEVSLKQLLGILYLAKGENKNAKNI